MTFALVQIKPKYRNPILQARNFATAQLWSSLSSGRKTALQSVCAQPPMLNTTMLLQAQCGR